MLFQVRKLSVKAGDQKEYIERLMNKGDPHPVTDWVEEDNQAPNSKCWPQGTVTNLIPPNITLIVMITVRDRVSPTV